ncbi:unnamed protein product [Mytilus edulis]|uniref:Uncharacterized protein n=1 Tax=Mytilus edulis TaxID=6550 RepID=A0A8S3QBE7_MYTED|nr:unnamed protein product [Mytilus edulis]
MAGAAEVATEKRFPSLNNDIKKILIEKDSKNTRRSTDSSPLMNTVQIIRMDFNILREFPSCALRNLNQLQHLYFSNQNIESVKIDELELKSLTYINLSKNKISNLSISNINNINNIQIKLDYNEITYLNISKVDRIHTITVTKNHLVAINYRIFQNSHLTLTYLDLSYNNLDDEVWKVLEGTKTLGTLRLKQNKLQTVSPFVINRLSNLIELDLSHNYITSLSDALFRSGKMTTILFNSNKLVNFPTDLVHDTNTFRDNSDCKLDISNNMLGNIHLTIPATNARLALNLGQNKLTAINLYSNNRELRALNISSNRLVTLPESLPKANLYIISSNPLNTTNVLKHLTTMMKDATEIDMDDIGFLCNSSEQYDYRNLGFSEVSTLSLRRNCIPPTFLCHIGKRKIDIHLDNNKIHYNSTKDMPCEIHTKDFGDVSFSGNRLSEMFLALFKSKYTNTISNVTSLYFKKSQMRELPFIRYASVSNYDNHVFDFSENFLEEFNGLEFITVPHSFTLNLENNRITKYEKITLKTKKDGYNYHVNLKYRHNSIARVNGSLTLIEIVGRLPFIYISIDLSFNRLHAFDLSAVINSDNGFSNILVQNINVSHNDLQEYRNCFQHVQHIQVLDFTYNKLKVLPENSCSYASETYLGHNSIIEISKALPTARISKLDLEWNLIHYIHDKAFTNITSLTTLILTGNMLINVPKAFHYLHNLQTLDISFNEITIIKQSDIGKMIHLNLLILTGNDLAPHPSTSIGVLGPIPGMELKDNIIHCNCDVLFLRNNTLNTHGRCSFPPEYEGYLISCFPGNDCVGNVPIYVYKKTKNMCLFDNYFDIKISMLKDDEILSVKWKRLGSKKQTGIKMKAYRKQVTVKQIVVNETGPTSSFFLSHSLHADSLCIYAYLNDRTFERCVDINLTKITGKPNSNNGAVYGTSAVLVLSVLLNILGSIFIFVFIRRKRPTNDTNLSQFDNNASEPNEYELSSSRRGAYDQQVDVYDQLSENINNTGVRAYENLNI